MASIQDIRQTRAPQRAWEYNVQITANTELGGKLPIIEQRVESAAIPEKSIETIIINYKGRKSHWAGRDSSPSTVTVEFWEDEEQSVGKFFDNWMENGLSNSIVGGGREAAIYTGEMVIEMLAHNSTTVTATHKFSRIFPISIGEASLNYEASEHKKVSVTFSFDVNEFTPSRGRL